jgi:tetratricopeptide (TPR) repeat protein
MPEKRKGFPPANVGDRPVIRPRGSKTGKSNESEVPAAGREGTAVAAQRLDASKQLDTFEAAMRLFHLRQLPAARQLFETAAAGPELDVAQRARLHMAMCDRRLQQPELELRSAEDCYNYSIALINLRRLAEARTHLERALLMEPNKDHLYYALALAQALGGDLAGAHASLKRAIELEPRNRILARQDADFAHLATQAPFDSLLYPEKKGW